MKVQHTCLLKYLFNSILTFIKKIALDSKLYGSTSVGQNLAIYFCLPCSLLDHPYPLWLCLQPLPVAFL